MTKPTDEQIMAHRENGMSAIKIARLHGVKEFSIQVRLKALGAYEKPLKRDGRPVGGTPNGGKLSHLK